MAKSKGRGRKSASKLGILGYGGYNSKGMQFDEETECYSPMGVGFGTQYEDLGEEYPEPGREKFGLNRTKMRQDEDDTETG